MKSLFFFLCMFFTFCTMPLPATAQNDTNQQQQVDTSWEGVYCDEKIDTCMKLYRQEKNAQREDMAYVLAMFYTQKDKSFLCDGEILLEYLEFGALDIVRSADGNTIETKFYATTDPKQMKNQKESLYALLVGNYTRVASEKK